MNPQVSLVCMSPSLVITSIEKTENSNPFYPFLCGNAQATASNVDKIKITLAQRQQLVPWFLQLLFYSPGNPTEDPGDGTTSINSSNTTGSRFLSYAETQHEISIVFEEELLSIFPKNVLEYEPTRWKALQVASAGAGTGEFLTQLQTLQELTTQLARYSISVFQISTYETDYILVKQEDFFRAVQCLQSFCLVETENGEMLTQDVIEDIKKNPSLFASSGGKWTETFQEAIAKDELLIEKEITEHDHMLSAPMIDLYLIQIQKSSLRKHMYALVRLLFGGGDGDFISSGNPDIEGNNNEDDSSKGKVFLSYSETGDEISVVTYDKQFIEQMKRLAQEGTEGVIVSPDTWKVVQIGDQKLGFAETGIVASQARVLSDSGSTVFYLSTFATDFLLVKEDEWDDVLPLLCRHFDVLEGRFATLKGHGSCNNAEESKVQGQFDSNEFNTTGTYYVV